MYVCVRACMCVRVGTERVPEQVLKKMQFGACSGKADWRVHHHRCGKGKPHLENRDYN